MTAHPVFDLHGRRILLVGTTGVLGRVYAKGLAEAGTRLALADRPGSDVLALATELGATGIEMDVAEEASVIDGVARAVAALGGLDGTAVNAAITGEGLMSAGGNPFAPLEEYPLAAWRKTLDVNLTGTFLVSREAGRAMKAGGGGSLVTVSSIYGVVGPDHRVYEGQAFASFPGYSATKAGVVGLTRWMATWWAKDGVRVNCLTPGGVYNEAAHKANGFADAYGHRTPMGRMANREDLLGMMLYLLSDASAYCTGQNFVVDGGFTAW